MVPGMHRSHCAHYLKQGKCKHTDLFRFASMQPVT